MNDAQWASTVPKGAGRTTVGVGYGASFPAERSIGQPTLGVEYRTGIDERWDFGMRFRPLDAGASVRRQLAKAHGIEASVAGWLGGGYVHAPVDAGVLGWGVTADVPFRVGIDVGRAGQLGLGATPRLLVSHETFQGSVGGFLGRPVQETRVGPTASGELSLAFDVRLSRACHLVPWVSAEAFYGSSSFTWRTDSTMLRGGLDVSF